MKAFFNSLAAIGIFLIAVSLMAGVIGTGVLVIVDIEADRPIGRALTIEVAEMLAEQPELRISIQEAYRGDDVITHREYLEIRKAYEYLIYQEAIWQIHQSITPVC